MNYKIVQDLIEDLSVEYVLSDAEDCFTVGQKVEMVKERNHLIPVIRLSELYERENSAKPAWESLGANMEGINGVAGGAVLSDGRVGLILDVHGIFDIASKGLTH